MLPLDLKLSLVLLLVKHLGDMRSNILSGAVITFLALRRGNKGNKSWPFMSVTKRAPMTLG